jgi:LuxR family maltose regulon positive regulatory protein
MPKVDALIRTKLHLPLTRPVLVSRPRLQARIAEGLRGPLTLVTAPAGFGKTTLVATCVAACGLPAAWLSLDRHDNQEWRFLSYLVAALRGANDRIGGEAAQLLAAARQASPEAVLTGLINDLEAAGRDIILVLDDYQFITDQTVREDVTFLVEHCPANLHLVLASRSDPPLPLARLRARGQTVALRAGDLSFTEPEAARFLSDVMGLQLDSGSVAAPRERTEGWTAGLQMAALSVRDRTDVSGFIAGFSGTNRYILDYLMEEVLAGQTEEVQRFLLCTSILERLTASLCDAVLAGGYPQSATILEHVERANLFLLPLDDERVWYRYHHLFADLLRARLHQAQPGLVPLLHIRASAWLEQQGQYPEAIAHLFAAHENGRAADLIERYGPVRLAVGDPSVLHMADALPHEMILARPEIGLYRSWLLIIQARIGEALPLLQGLAQQLAGAAPQSGRRWMQTFIASALAFLAPPGSPLGPDSLPD